MGLSKFQANVKSHAVQGLRRLGCCWRSSSSKWLLAQQQCCWQVSSRLLQQAPIPPQTGAHADWHGLCNTSLH